MQKLKRIFSPNSTSSVTEKKNFKQGPFRRSHSSSSIIDESKNKAPWKIVNHHSLNPPKKPDSLSIMTSRSAGALFLDTNVHNNDGDLQYSPYLTEDLPYNYSSSSTHPQPQDFTVPLTTPLILSNNMDSINKTQQSPNTRQNEADNFIQQAIQFHEANELEKATYYFKLAADKDSPLGLFLYGIALRHGWGCKPNAKLAVRYLQKAAESAVSDLHASMAANLSVARHELVLAIYELGVCFRHGWGVPKNKNTAAYYFEIAANFGDPDAQNDLAFCYVHGEGVKKDMKKAAKYYRMAAAQGGGILGNSWIFKKKYDDQS